jgi:hypothetical protein
MARGYNAFVKLAAAAILAGVHRSMAEAYQAIGFEGRGKGRTRTHDGGGTRRAQRAAVKARNVQRHRAACRG